MKLTLKKIMLLLIMVFVSLLAISCKVDATLTFNKTNYELTVGDIVELTPVISNSESLVKYSLDKEGVISLEGNTITALEAGEVTITAYLELDKDINATITVKVVKKNATLTFETKNYELTVGDTVELKPVVTNSDSSVTYSLDKEGIISLEGNVITALEEGEVTITASLENDSEVKETLTVKVSKKAHVHEFKEVVKDEYLCTPATSTSKATYYKSCECGEVSNETFEYGEVLSVSVESITILNKFDEFLMGETKELEVEILPLEAANKKVTWTASSDYVEFDGNLLLNDDIGEITITVECDGKTDSFTYYSYDVLQSIEITTSDINYNIGDEITLTVVLEPASAKQDYKISCDLEENIEISDDNTIKFLKSGVITFTVESEFYDMTQTYKIRVRELVEKIKITGEKEMFESKTQTLTYELTPDTFVLKEVVWTSSDETIATVDDKGVVSALKSGNVTITATSVDAGKAFGTFDIVVKDLPKETDNVYVSSEVADLEIGNAVSYNGVQYIVGTNAFANLNEAIVVARKVVYLNKYIFEDNYTINKSDIKFVGDENNTKVLKVISLADGVSNVTFEGITFSELGQIVGINNNNNISIIGCTFNKSTVDSSSGIVLMKSTASNLVVKNCDFIDSACGRCIRNNGVLDGLVVENCTFSGSGIYEAIRAIDALKGEVSISNNIFYEGIQPAILISAHANGTFKINENKFYKQKAGCIDIRLSTEKNPNAKFEIMYNTFDNTDIYSESWEANDSWGCIRFRAKGYTLETLTFNANYNKFIKWGNFLFDNAANTSDLVFANFDYNYFDVEVKSADFSDIALSFDHLFESIEALDNVLIYKDINTSDDTTLVVGENENVTKTKYATLEAALADAKEGDTIYLLPGTYSEDVTINVNNLTITSLNGNLDTKSEYRNEEAVYEGKITLAKQLENLTISGIKFTGNAQILDENCTGGSKGSPKMNTVNFVFKNNYVVLNNSSAVKGFIAFDEADYSYSKDTKIQNNYFETLSTNKAQNVIYFDNTYDLVFENNTFENINTTGLYVADTSNGKGLSGKTSIINSNVFKNITGEAIHINWVAPLPTDKDGEEIQIENNKFENISSNAIYFGKINNGANYTSIKFMFNEFASVQTGIYIERVQDTFNMEAKYNIFKDVPEKYYFVNNNKNSKSSPEGSLDAQYNLYYVDSVLAEPSSNKFSGDVNYSNHYTSTENVPNFDSSASGIKIKDNIVLYVKDEKQLEVEFTPDNVVDTKVIWQVSDESIATIDDKGVITCLKAGKVTITAIYEKKPSIISTLVVEIKPYQSIEVRYEGKSIINVDETLQLNVTLLNLEGKIIYTSLNQDIATVDGNGLVTALKAGKATIKVTVEGSDLQSEINLEVKDITEYSELMQLLIESHNDNVMYKTINYIGYEAGYESVPHNVYGSVNAFYAGENPEIIDNMLTTSAKNVEKDADGNFATMKSIEFIVVHDTGSASPAKTALANSNWCTSTGNSNSSWHYTVGNDGIYRQLEDNVIAWHAGDDTGWSDDNSTTFVDTGVKYVKDRPTVTISEDGYFVINGTKSNVASPRKEDGSVETRTNELGILVVRGSNDNYWIPTTWITKSYTSPVAIRGGNTNGIGIESAVNSGSDVYYTWQRLAKLVAQLLVKYNLLPDRVAFHNSFANKPCPNTMISNNLVDMFLEMVYTEYNVLKNYSDYKIEFISNNPDIIDNTGRIVNAPENTTNVSYTIRITKGETVEEVTLNSVVPGTKTLNA